ncbi:MAG TPA: DNA-directed RNA polymerase subunit beta [bacterium]|nr:DNA-directed RNA polymerase subunit beta [Chlamydiota bacterium]HOE27931.1 DNA-directed RNA polymerase subunit beta [bacterium]
MSAKKTVRDYSRLRELIPMPNLVEIQTQSYEEFLQPDVLPTRRKLKGLQEVFREVFPIKSYDETCSLEYVGYDLGRPKYDLIECRRRGLTYSAPLRVTLRLCESGNIKEETVYFGSIPLMTEQGTFIINGAERVIVSQLHRSPGVCFEKPSSPKAVPSYWFRIIPYRGSWLEGELDANDTISLYIDRRRRRRKIQATTFLRAAGYVTDEAILESICGREEVSLAEADEKTLAERTIIQRIVDPSTQAALAVPGGKLSKSVQASLLKAGVKRVAVAASEMGIGGMLQMLERDRQRQIDSQDEALKEIYKRLRPGDPANISSARTMLKRIFFDPRHYDLGRVGRFKLNKKLGMEVNDRVGILRKEDVAAACRYLLGLRHGEVGRLDDIDHLGNRRVRSVGELLQNQCRIGLARMERLTKERMNVYDMSAETVTPHRLINPKAFTSVIRDFFGRSQLSQFMDQTNPLAEITHKRRLSALGPGGLSRDRAGFEVRDVHTSHYGRICPIETPEGPNIGLISSLSTFARVNSYGFLESPYWEVRDGKVCVDMARGPVWLTADEEETHVIAQANAKVDERNRLIEELVSARERGEFVHVAPGKVEFIDVSPKQLVSVAAGLIPFLEHNDANRALMGSNMQRQAVPLLTTEAPIVVTGLETQVARDTGVMTLAQGPGEVVYADGAKIVVRDDRERDACRTYRLIKNFRSNAGTCINQRPVVRMGDRIRKGDVLADGPATKDGELALGRNILVAFMPWGGYNFEDAILISERLVMEDAYTSIHIEEFEIGARDTKLGREEITRDIPNVGEEALKDLGEDGIVRLGAEVKAGDILVGKITPKSETELSPEERLLRAIFGEKAADVRDASLTVPSGTEGIVMDVKVFSRKDAAQTDEERHEERRRIKEITDASRKRIAKIKEERDAKLAELVKGKQTRGQVINIQTGEVIIPAGVEIKKPHLQRLQEVDFSDIEIEDDEEERDGKGGGDDAFVSGIELKRILLEFMHALEEAEMAESREIDKFKRGDELDPGLIKQVKVYVASKRKLQVGDKMAGRHGNKGVIAKILPEEDMPFLPDGTPVDMVLNPLGVPSRMNVGQLLETHLGWAAKMLGIKVTTPVFNGITELQIKELMKQAGLPASGKVVLSDGRTGDRFEQEVTVGYLYMMKLSHLVSDKIHARATGPYSLVTQQPLGGKAQFGGQRFGEMEVWALEAYGAAYALQELLTVKSDDVVGRTKIYESIVKGQNSLEAGTPESFNVLIKEMQSLCLDVRTEKKA